MESAIWPVMLMLAAFTFIALELFIPSGGLLSLMAVICLISSIVVAFFSSIQLGVVMLAVSAIGVPAVLAAVIKWWPRTPIGRLLLIGLPDNPDDVLPDTEAYRGLADLVGRRGVSKSVMLPSGVVIIDGHPYDAVSEGMAIEADQPVEVVRVRTQRLIVRPATGKPLPDDRQAEDALTQPLDSLGIEGFEEPLN